MEGACACMDTGGVGIGIGLIFGLKLSGSCSMGIEAGRSSNEAGGYVSWRDLLEYLNIELGPVFLVECCKDACTGGEYSHVS